MPTTTTPQRSPFWPRAAFAVAAFIFAAWGGYLFAEYHYVAAGLPASPRWLGWAITGQLIAAVAYWGKADNWRQQTDPPPGNADPTQTKAGPPPDDEPTGVLANPIRRRDRGSVYPHQVPIHRSYGGGQERTVAVEPASVARARGQLRQRQPEAPALETMTPGQELRSSGAFTPDRVAGFQEGLMALRESTGGQPTFDPKDVT